MKQQNIVIVVGIMLAACASVPLAPGADQVKITKNASDVTGCTPVGNLDNSIHVNVDKKFENDQVSNQAVGLGGNAVFETTAGAKVSGVVYRCGKTPPHGQ